MRPRGIETWNARLLPEALSEDGIPAETIKRLNSELLRLATETEALWSTFLDCAKDASAKKASANDALVRSCIQLTQFFEGVTDAGISHHIEPAVLQKAGDEYWIACKLLGKVIR